MGEPPSHPTQPAPQEPLAGAASAGDSPLDGGQLRSLFADASSLLQRHVQALNAINVFPVPDGDTGTNMHLTLQAAVAESTAAPGDDIASAAQAIAHGALMGARGNSGVILSQILSGLADGLAHRRTADGPALASALLTAADAAYGALAEPAEGTILTAIRAAAQAVAGDGPTTTEDVLAKAAAAAKEATDRTPELLPVLKEAGVVDAGALGLAVILEGLLRSLRGEPLDVNLAADLAVEAGWRSDAAALHNAAHGESGYCTEFVVGGVGLEPAAARERLQGMGTSLLVVGRGELLRVHLHTVRPDDALAYGRTLGELSQVKVDNLEAQIQQFASAETAPAGMTGAIGVVAVAAGEGIEATFRSVGVTRLVRGGQTMNPSAGEILEAIEACPEERVVVLPNNKNIIAAAQQAAERASRQAAVVPTRSIPQGIAALLALTPDLAFEANTAAMERAMTSVRSAEVTRAARATVVEGRRIELGQAIGVLDGELAVVADDIAGATEACVEEMLSPEATLLTLYAGRDVREEEVATLAETLRERYQELEIEVVRGGQPHYPYILSLE